MFLNFLTFFKHFHDKNHLDQKFLSFFEKFSRYFQITFEIIQTFLFSLKVLPNFDFFYNINYIQSKNSKISTF